MLKIISKSQELINLFKDKGFDEVRIAIRTNEIVFIYVKILPEKETINNKREIEELVRENSPQNFKFRVYVLTEAECEEEELYVDVFNNTNPIQIDTGRRRYNSLWNNKSINNPCPVITFHSHKGGTGRTTAIGVFAMYLAQTENKKVAILDCNFESPGFINPFLKNNKSGIVEYLIDKNTGLTQSNEIIDYIWKVHTSYPMEGGVIVMPCGNLSDCPTEDFLQNSFNHYLEGLSRIDFSNTDYMLQQFSELINDLYTQLGVDVVLIDLPSGISDMFGMTVLNLSDFVVGFFKGDTQSLIGVQFLLERTINKKKVILVNSILPEKSEYSLLHEEYLKNIIRKKTLNEIKLFNLHELSIFPIYRNSILEYTNTLFEPLRVYADRVQPNLTSDYEELFNALMKEIKSLSNSN
jgi:MinD-like ATPase involved in chromosome partitioning or flagellar assembly